MMGTKVNSNLEKIILGVDPGTNVMGYGVLKVVGNKAEMMAMGVIELKKYESHYLRLGKIFERVTSIIESYKPDEMAIEAPFFGKNVQSMLKLGRAQGVAITAAIMRDIPITEYEPRKIKVAITGNGSAAKCGDITILSTVTLVTVTPGTGATAAIGQGHESSTVGTVTIETGANVV